MILTMQMLLEAGGLKTSCFFFQFLSFYIEPNRICYCELSTTKSHAQIQLHIILHQIISMKFET